MNKGPIFWLLVALGLIVVVEAVRVVANAVQGRRYFLAVATASAGHELIVTTNASQSLRVGPELRASLAELLASPTRVSTVLLGDEPLTTGDGHASSRLVLTNELGWSLTLRLRLRHDSGQGPIFDVLSYSKTNDAAQRK